jgi:hypothetical protein
MDRLAPSLDQQRVHVAPLGYEFDRIVDPLRPGADVVYLLVDDPTREPAETGTVDFDADCTSRETDPASWLETTDYQREVRDAISEFARVGGFPVRLDDFYDVMGVVTTIAAHHDAGAAGGDDVYVNISTGPHAAAVAAAVGCMAAGARPYSVTPESFAHDHEARPRTEGTTDPVGLPIHPIDGPSSDQVAVLRFLADKAAKNHDVNKRDIIRAFDGDGERGDATLECLLGTEEKAWSARYNKLESRVLDDLEDRGYVHIARRGRSDYVEITDSGHKILAAFEHLLTE